MIFFHPSIILNFLFRAERQCRLLISHLSKTMKMLILLVPTNILKEILIWKNCLFTLPMHIANYFEESVGRRNSLLFFEIYEKIDETRLKFCKKFDKITETTDEIFEKFVWTVW